MAETALDKRQPQSVADRAAVRLGAAIRHNAYLLAAPKETESQSLQVYGQSLQTEHPHLATRYLEEEASKGCKTARRDRSFVTGGPLAAGGTENHCLLWGLGLCSVGDRCRFLHACPFKGTQCGPAGGCLLERGRDGHLQTLQRWEVKEKILGKPFRAPERPPQRRPRSRSRSPSRRKRSCSGSAGRPAPQQRKKY
jgi:hypothetical protein